MTEPTRVHHGLTSILLDAGVVTPEQIDDGLARQRETGLRIGETLVEIGAATEEDIGWALARQLGLPFVDLQSGTLDPELLRSVPAGLLYRLHAVPLLRSDEGLSVAFSDPTDVQAAAHLEAIAGCPVRISVTTPSAIRRVLAPLLGAHAAAAGARPARGPAQDAAVVWDRSGANFLHFHLFAARRAAASAVHFVPEPGGVRVVQRRPEGLVPVATEPPEVYEALLTQLELLGAPVGDLARDLHRLARIECPTPAGAMAIDVALLAHDGATTATLRLPSPEGTPAGLEDLGLAPEDVARVREILHRPAGLVVVSGPVGSGCSTTLACLLAEALREDRSAMVFGELPGGPPASRVVFALPGDGARDRWEPIVTAHDPDVVVLDDVVSGEDVSALTAGAGMGRLMLARADWGDTFALLEHLAARPHARSAAASRLHLVLQQRLLRPADLSPGGGAGAARDGPRAARDDATPRGGGTATSCDGAPASRARFEVLVLSGRIRAAIRGGANARTLRRLAHAEGFRDLDAILDDDVRSGRLDAAAASRVLSS